MSREGYDEYRTAFLARVAAVDAEKLAAAYARMEDSPSERSVLGYMAAYNEFAETAVDCMLRENVDLDEVRAEIASRVPGIFGLGIMRLE